MEALRSSSGEKTDTVSTMGDGPVHGLEWRIVAIGDTMLLEYLALGGNGHELAFDRIGLTARSAGTR
jgi:hypothetical protein